MKWATGIILALLVGIAVGGWSPRARVRRLKTALADAQSGQEGGRSRGGSVSPTITGLLQIPEAKTDRTPDRVGEESNAVPTGVAAPSNQTDTAVAAASPAASPDAADEEGRQDLAARIEAAAEVWRLRSEVARDQFLARVDANAQESTRFQVLLETMNLRIGESIDNWAAVLREGTLPREEVVIRMMSEITSSLTTTYDELDRSMPEGWREQDDDALSLTDFIDPDVATPLIGLDDELEMR